jgi:ABC-type sugar transport system ATPase subunit
MAARPEHLSVAAADKEGIPGEITVIQHLGHIVRYEVKVGTEFSGAPLEVDMDGMVRGLSEHDSASVQIRADKIALYEGGSEY